MLGQNLFFGADDGTNGAELWTSDGTAAGTVLVKDIAPSQGSTPKRFTMSTARCSSPPTDGTGGEEPGKSDGTASWHRAGREISTGALGSAPKELVNVGGALFFAAHDETSMAVSYGQSDGTEAGTMLVKDIEAGSVEAAPSGIVDLGGLAYFSADSTTSGLSCGRAMAAKPAPRWSGYCARPGLSLVEGITVFQGKLYFAAFEPATGIELWTSDGTRGRTLCVAERYQYGNRWLAV